MKYTKKPVEIEALVTNEEQAHDTLEWVRSGGGKANFGAVPGSLEIVTLEGVMVANPGDFVICGVQGEFYPCKPDIFAATYDAVTA